MESKLFLIIIFLSLLPALLPAQDIINYDNYQKKNLDSLQWDLEQAATDTERINIYEALGNYYIELNRDSALYFVELCLLLAQKTNSKIKEAAAVETKGYILMKFGRYAESLNCFLQAVKIAEDPATEKTITGLPDTVSPRNARLDVLANIHHDWGHLMRNTDNIDQARNHYLETKRIATAVNDISLLALANMNLGNVYIKLNLLDSALIFEREAAELLKKTGFLRYLSNTYRFMGDIYLKKGKTALALKFYYIAVQEGKLQNNRSSISTTYSALTNYYLQQGQKDSSLYYALLAKKEIASLGAEASGEWNLGAAYNNLYLAYELNGQPDSVLKYLKLGYSTKDSLYRNRIKSFTAFQNLTFREQLRLKELEDAQVAMRNKIRTYGLLGFIGIFLLIVFFLYRNNLQKQKANTLLQQTLTDLKSTQTQLVAQKERAEHSEKVKQRFLANMSHEIRTPMNAVIGMTDLLLHKKPREEQFYYLNSIKKSADNLLRIINDILDISKIEAGKMELENIDFSIDDLIGQVVMTLQHKADEKKLHLKAHLARNVPDILIGDPVRLSQVLMNLTGNAIKFTEKGSVEIYVSEVPESGAIQFSVVDTGIGIPKDKLLKVFESFSQANTTDTRKHGGTGLGLSISQELVGLMGGQITIDSREGFGTTFSFVLNLPTGSKERLEQRLASEDQLNGTLINDLSILIVDDNEFNLAVAKDGLELNSNADVVGVDSAQKAFDLLKTRTFDVILMDVQMPDMNGFDAARYIREHLEAPVKNIPIIALTASVLRTDLDKCKEAGMNSYVAKPYKLPRLVAEIAAVLARSS